MQHIYFLQDYELSYFVTCSVNPITTITIFQNSNKYQINQRVIYSPFFFFSVHSCTGYWYLWLFQILQADGSNQSACINAATLALIDAGIPMKDYVSACTVSFVNDKPLMDINYLEESFGGPQLSLAVLPKSGNIVMFQMDSRLHVDNLEKVLDLAKKGCTDIHALQRQTVHEFSQECLPSLTGNWDFVRVHHC